MKALRFLAAVAFSAAIPLTVSAQTSSRQEDNNPAMQSAAHNKDQVRKLYKACLNKRAYDLLPTLVSDAYAGPNGERGPDGMAATIKPLIAAFPDMQWTIDDLLADGEKVVVRWTWHGTQSAEFRGFPNSGKAVTNHAIAVYELREGKIVGVHMESDRLGFFTQIGVVPQALVTPPGKK